MELDRGERGRRRATLAEILTDMGVTVLLLSNLGTFVIGYVSYVSCMYFACILHVS